jgi:hypothetical protein
LQQKEEHRWSSLTTRQDQRRRGRPCHRQQRR